jgi:hypothetical protein
MEMNKELTYSPGFNTINHQLACTCTGEMAERSKAAVLKTAERKFRGFESLSLRRGIGGEVTERLKVSAC